MLSRFLRVSSDSFCICFILTRFLLGGENVLRAFTRNDFPEDPEQIFLTSWGEWWPKDVYELTLDKDLQGKWCLGKEEIEREEGIVN